MKLEFKLAFKNLFGAKLRTLLNIFVLSFSFVIIIFLNSIMDGWDQQAQKDSVEWEFGEGHLLHNDYDPLDSYTILDGHGEIPKRSIGMTPVLERQASVYPQGRMIGVVLKGIPADQKILKLPTKKLNQNKDQFPVIIGKRFAVSAKLKKGDRVQIRWRDKNGTYDANTIIIEEIFDSNVPNIDNGKIWIDIEKLWKMTGLENQATYFTLDQDFRKGSFDSWTYRSKTTLLKNLKDLIDQKKASQSVIFGLLLAIALLAIFDTQILSIFRRQKEIGTYIALGMTRLRVVRLFTIEGSVYSIMALIFGSIYGIPFFIYMSKAGFPIPPADQKLGIAIADVIYPVYGLKLILLTILTVIISATVVSYLPARKIAKLNPVLALKGKKQ